MKIYNEFAICTSVRPSLQLFVWVVFLTLAGTGNSVAAGDHRNDAGLLIHIERTGHGDFFVTGATEVSRYVEPRDSGAPAEWMITVGSVDGEPDWSTLIPSALLPHVPVRSDGSREFSIMIPARFKSRYVRLFDERGQKLAEFAISEALVDHALKSAKTIQSELRAMRQDAQSIQRAQKDGKSETKSAVLAQMRHEMTRSSVALEPDPEAAASGLWQDTGDLPIGLPERATEPTLKSDQRQRDPLGANLSNPGSARADFSTTRELSAEQREIEISRKLELQRLARMRAEPVHNGIKASALSLVSKGGASAGTQAETATLTGNLELADGGSLTEGFWAQLREDGRFIKSAWVDTNGEFQLDIPVGRNFELIMRPPVPYLFAAFPVRIDGPVTLTYTLERGQVLTGQIETSDGTPLPAENFWVQLYRDGEFLSSHLVENAVVEVALEAGVEYRLDFRSPVPYLRRSHSLSITADSVRQFEIERGFALDGQIITSDGASFNDGFWIWIRRSNANRLTSLFVAADGSFRTAVEKNTGYTLRITPPIPYLREEEAVTLTRDSEITFEVQRGAVLNGRLLTSDRNSFAEEALVWFYREEDNTFFDLARADTEGSFKIPLEAGTPFRADIRPPAPYLDTSKPITLEADATRSFDVQRGVVASVGVFDEAGMTILADRINLTQNGRRQLFRPESTARLPIVLEPAVPGTMSVEPPDSQALMTRNIALEARTTDFDLDVVLERGSLLSGVVRDNAGQPLAMSELRFYRGGDFFKSVETLGDGSYELLLPHGEYRVRVSVAVERNFAQNRPATVFEIAPMQVVIDEPEEVFDPTLNAPLHTVTLERFLPGSNFMRARLNFRRSGERGGNIYSWVSGEEVEVMAGTYDIDIDYPGFSVATLSDVRITGDLRIDLANHFHGDQAIWSGVLRDPEGRPLPEVAIRVYDDAHWIRAFLQTDAGGRFEIPLGKGLYAEVGGGPGFAMEGGLVKKLVELDRPLQPKDADITLSEIEFAVAAPRPGELFQLYGDRAPADGFNIIFLGDGYTNIRETFSDQNKNGVWDGVLFVDVDGNGVWDSGEPVTVYGDADLDRDLDDGTNVANRNEPFDDLNGDGFPNFDDRAVFELNIRNFVRALLGSHVWSESPELFNAFGFFTPSVESGSGIIDADDRQIISRDTFYSSNMKLARRTLTIDWAKARATAAEVLPEHDLIVVLLNQPVPMGRANSFIVFNGGMKAGSPVSRTPHHEMGHAFSFLADEYQEFPRTYEGTEPAAVNVTTFSNRAGIPWAEFLEDGAAIPTSRKTGGMGLFTGGRYHQGGIFRPTEQSTMRSNAPKFNAISEKATSAIMLERFGIDREVLFDDGFER